MPWRRAWQPLSREFLPGESHAQGRLVGYSPWGHRESDTTEWLSTAKHSQESQNLWFVDSLSTLKVAEQSFSNSISLVTPLSPVLPERSHNSRDSVRLSGIFQDHLPVFFTSVTSAKPFWHVKFWSQDVIIFREYSSACSIWLCLRLGVCRRWKQPPRLQGEEFPA